MIWKTGKEVCSYWIIIIVKRSFGQMEINIQIIICDPSYFLREIPVQLDLLSQNVHQTLINHPAIWQMLSSLHKLYLYSLGNPLSGKKIITFNYSTIKLKRTTFTHFTYFPKLTVVNAKTHQWQNMLMCMLKETIRGIFLSDDKSLIVWAWAGYWHCSKLQFSLQ